MKIWHWVIIIIVLLTLAGGYMLMGGGNQPWVSKPPAKSKGLLRIASFNVEGLFDPADDPRLSGNNDDVPSDQSHLEAIASAIRAVDADILALQDVESSAALDWFNRKYLSSLGYEYIASLDVGHPRGIENAVLSRYPISNSRVWPKARLGGKHPATAGGKPNPYAGKPLSFKRSPLMVEIDVPGKVPLTLLVVEHKGGDKFDYWRKAEVNAIAKLCTQIGMSRRIIILGSFHSDPDDPSLQPYFDIGFSDPFAAGVDSEFYATEVSGDRTDFILANRAVGGDLELGKRFVLGGDFAEQAQLDETKTTHLPVVIGLRYDEK
jgi:endonuclease/exonuclease/phosphatase family protein